MKKIILFGAASFALLSLVACSDNSSESKSNTETSTTEQASKPDNSKFNEIIKELKKDLDKDNEGLVDIKITNDAIDENFDKGHTIIDVIASETSAKNIKPMLDAINSGEATDNEKLGIQAIRQEISDTAKKLPDNTTQINFSLPIDSDNSQLVAASTKTKDIIHVIVD